MFTGTDSDCIHLLSFIIKLINIYYMDNFNIICCATKKRTVTFNSNNLRSKEEKGISHYKVLNILMTFDLRYLSNIYVIS